jgi:hypothetical protein
MNCQFVAGTRSKKSVYTIVYNNWNNIWSQELNIYKLLVVVISISADFVVAKTVGLNLMID